MPVHRDLCAYVVYIESAELRKKACYYVNCQAPWSDPAIPAMEAYSLHFTVKILDCAVGVRAE